MNNWQRDPKWVNTKLGFSNTTIGDFGCTISAIGNIIGVTPVVVNDRMKAVSGFAQGNLVIWAKIEEAFPGVKIRRVWSYTNADVKANTPNVIVEVNAAPIGSPRGQHWVQYLGNQRLNDPWTGKERPTSDFPGQTGYCVITGKWQGGDSSMANMYKGYDLANPESMKVAVDVLVRLQAGEFVDKPKYEALEKEAIELRKRPVSCPPATTVNDPKADKLRIALKDFLS